jgi:hypothetical protein
LATIATHFCHHPTAFDMHGKFGEIYAGLAKVIDYDRDCASIVGF